MRTLIVLALMTLSLSASAARLAEIETGRVAYDSSVDHGKIVAAIKKACLGRGWGIKEEKGNQIIATLHLRSHYVELDINWSDGEIRLEYITSRNLKYKEKKGKRMIHGRYNSWVQNLVRDINVYLIE